MSGGPSDDSAIISSALDLANDWLDRSEKLTKLANENTTAGLSLVAIARMDQAQHYRNAALELKRALHP